MQIETIDALATEHNITVNMFEVKVLTSNGEEWTIGGTPSEEALIQQDKFDSMLENIQTITGDTNPEIKGIYALWVDVPISCLKSLQSNVQIELVDVSPTFVLLEVQQQGFTGSLKYSLTDLYETAILFDILPT